MGGGLWPHRPPFKAPRIPPTPNIEAVRDSNKAFRIIIRAFFMLWPRAYHFRKSFVHFSHPFLWPWARAARAGLGARESAGNPQAPGQQNTFFDYLLGGGPGGGRSSFISSGVPSARLRGLSLWGGTTTPPQGRCVTCDGKLLNRCGTTDSRVFAELRNMLDSLVLW